jgi:serine protease AprX
LAAAVALLVLVAAIAMTALPGAPGETPAEAGYLYPYPTYPIDPTGTTTTTTTITKEETTTTTTMPPKEETTTTTVPPEESTDSFVQWEDAGVVLGGLSPGQHPGAMAWITNQVTGAEAFWNRGFDGSGVDVALIDTGVVPVDGLTYPGKVINGPDLSFESQADNLRYLDTFGHGTHLAGIIAGRDDADSEFTGMAPGARIVNLKVADSQGAVDVSQVIAAIDWAIQHRTDPEMNLNIRVIILAYGTDATQPYQTDPLAHAVQKAWDAGIVVVVAAGNDGNAALLRNPATNPSVIAVGAAHNDTSKIYGVTEFSSCGTSERFVDVVAPGRSILSLRNPGSYADVHHPQAVVEGGYFLGSGTSQAAAVVAGGVALMLDHRPELNPDQVKALLTSTAGYVQGADFKCQGAGSIDLAAAKKARTPKATSVDQTYTVADGTGSLEAARGSNHVYDEGIALQGEIDIMSNPWTGYCTDTGCLDTLWDGGVFNGSSWSGSSWSGSSWSGSSWSGSSWSGSSWSGSSWSSKSWSGASWSGSSWSGASWSGSSWSGSSWSGNTWSGLSWN